MWIEQSMLWLADRFGRQAARGEIALPRAAFYPAGYEPTPAKMRELVLRVGAVIGVEEDRTALEHVSLDVRHAVDPLAHPAVLAAIIAHELARARLLGRDRAAADPSGDERLTELAALFLGMGVFAANSAHLAQRWTMIVPTAADGVPHVAQCRRATGHLDEAEFGYALACLCGLRRETEPSWAGYVHPSARVMLWRSLAYLRRIAHG